MISPYEFLKDRRPEEFSDSKIIKSSRLTSEFVEYHLSTLGNRSEEKPFEDLAILVCEKVICPNLKPQTGSTGGGDSKADSENLPVSDFHMIKHFYGYENEAAKDLWAFAFSTMKDVGTKVRSDVKNLHETNRGYKRVYFVSSQFVRDKRRSELEDELKKAYSIEVKVLDRAWLKKQIEVWKLQDDYIDIFGLDTEIQEEKKIGPNDYKKLITLEDIDSRFSNAMERLDIDNMLDDLLDAAIYSRELENPIPITDDYFKRIYELSKELGRNMLEFEVVYEWAKTKYWWHSDYETFTKLYIELESKLNPINITQIDMLFTVWMLYYTQSQIDNVLIEANTTKLKEVLKSIIDNKDLPNSALEARSMLAFVEFTLSKDIDKLIGTSIIILNESEMNSVFDFDRFNKMINVLYEVVEDNDKFDELILLLSKKASERSTDIITSRTILKLATKSYEKRPYNTISLCCSVIEQLYKKETYTEFKLTLNTIGQTAHGMDLRWMSRKYMINYVHVSLNDYMTTGEISKDVLDAIRVLIEIEIKNGRIKEVLRWRDLMYILTKNVFNLEFNLEEDLSIDYSLAFMILLSQTEEIKKLCKIIDLLENKELYISAYTIKYLAGISYDKDFYKLLGDYKTDDDFFGAIIEKNSSVVDISKLSIKNDNSIHLTVLGCRMNIRYNEFYYTRVVAEYLAAAIESFFATALHYRIAPKYSNIIVNVNAKRGKTEKLDYKVNLEKQTVNLKISLDERNYQAFEDQFLGPKVLEIVGFILFNFYLTDDPDNLMTSMFRDENVVNRVMQFSYVNKSIEYIFGEYFDYSKVMNESDSDYDFNESVFDIKRKHLDSKVSSVEPSESDDEKEGFDPSYIERVKHSEIEVDDVINMYLWDNAKWKGTLYLRIEEHHEIPGVGFMYEDYDVGVKVFEEWLSKFSDTNINDSIQVALIMGVDVDNPNHYKVAVAGNYVNLAKIGVTKLIHSKTRYNTMTPPNSINLDGFLAELEWFKEREFKFYIYPANAKNPWDVGGVKYRIMMRKIDVIDACSIERDTWYSSAISTEDKPITDGKVVSEFIKSKFLDN